MHTGTPFDSDPSTPLRLHAMPRRLRRHLSRAARRDGPVVRDAGAAPGRALGAAACAGPCHPAADLRAVRESLIGRARHLLDDAAS